MAAVAAYAAPIIGLARMRSEDVVAPTWEEDKWVKDLRAPFTGDLHEVFTVRAPNGQAVPVYKSIARKTEGGDRDGNYTYSVLASDGEDEVATPDNPACDYVNATAYRVAKVYIRTIIQDPVCGRYEGARLAGNFDYSVFGFQKIGKIWVDPLNRKDVESAKQRIVNDKSLCIIL